MSNILCWNCSHGQPVWTWILFCSFKKYFKLLFKYAFEWLFNWYFFLWVWKIDLTISLGNFPSQNLNFFFQKFKLWLVLNYTFIFLHEWNTSLNSYHKCFYIIFQLVIKRFTLLHNSKAHIHNPKLLLLSNLQHHKVFPIHFNFYSIVNANNRSFTKLPLLHFPLFIYSITF